MAAGDRSPTTPPPLLAWTLIVCSAALAGVAALAALLVVDPRSGLGGVLTVAVIGAGLLTMLLCAIAAARIQDAHQAPAAPLSPGSETVPAPDATRWSEDPPRRPPIKAGGSPPDRRRVTPGGGG